MHQVLPAVSTTNEDGVNEDLAGLNVDPGLLRVAGGISSFLAVAVALLGLLVMLGWWADIRILQSLTSRWTPMRFNGALCFFLSGLSLWLQRKPQVDARVRWLARAAAVLVIALGALTWTQDLLGVDLRIDQLLMTQPSYPGESVSAGRMAQPVAFGFVLFGVALLTLDYPGKKQLYPAGLLALLAGFLGLVGVIAYSYGFEIGQTDSPLEAVPMHTASGFVLLSVGILSARAESRPVSLLLKGGRGAEMARRLLPLAVLLPLVTGGLGLMGLHLGLFDVATNQSLYTAINVFCFAWLVWKGSSWLHEIDLRSRQSERASRLALQHANQSLELRIAEAGEELRAANRELEATSLRASLATQTARIGIWEWDPGADTLIWTDLMYEILRRDPKAGPPSYEIWKKALHPDDVEAAEQALGAALEVGAPFDTTFRVVAGGETRWIRATATVLRDENEQNVRMVGANWDVTELQRAAQAMRAREEVLEEFVRQAPAAIAMLDRELRFLQVSQSWLDDFHLSREKTIGNFLFEALPEAPEHWRNVLGRVLQGRVERVEEDRFPRAGGEIEWLQWEARPWKDSQAEVAGLILFCQIITERKEVTLKLEHSKRELERSNQDLAQFAYAASHDLQEPLRAISGCVQILQKRLQSDLDPDNAELMGHIVEGAERMQRLIHDLLSYSRVSTRGQELVLVDSGEVLQEALGLLRGALEESHGTVSYGTLPEVYADASQLKQLFTNLLGNALKYRGAEPARISVLAHPVDKFWQFSIVDNGIGIEPQHFERIFVLFQRLHNRNEHPGTGIGLALCKKIVERHNGRIWVESEPGKGSTFHFTLLSGEGEDE